MTPRAIRSTVIVVFVVGIAGMIVSSVAEASGAAITFGLITASAALSLMLVTAVSAAPGVRFVKFDEEDAAKLEERVQALIAEGADETAVRDLVRAGVRLGRTGRLR